MASPTEPPPKPTPPVPGGDRFADESVIARIPLALPARGLWRWLIEPAAALGPEASRLQARWLAGVMLVLTASSAIGVLAIHLRRGTWNLALILGTAIGALSYAFSRGPRQALAALLAVLALSVPAIGSALAGGERDAIQVLMAQCWLALPMMLSTLILTTSQALLVNLMGVLFVAVLPWLEPATRSVSMWIPLSFLLPVATFGVVGGVLRLQNIRAFEQRLRDLHAAELSLLATRRELAQQVADSDLELRRRHMTLQALVRSSPVAVFMHDTTGRVTLWNPAAQKILGWREPELMGAPNPLLGVLQRTLGERLRDPQLDVELALPDRQGNLIAASVSTAPIEDDEGTMLGLIGLVVDVSERHRLQDQLRQAQKMEAVGRLAGGVAHDFNNLLNVILGNAELALMDTEPGGELATSLVEIRGAAERAANLTRQLLAFSRQQPLAPQPVQINHVVKEMSALLRRLIPEDVRLELALEGDLPRVEIDPNQVEQVVLNLVVNACDAMPDGGLLRIATRSCPGADGDAAAPTAPEVVLEIADSGVGMDAQVRARLFEPFFTTKPLGQGTGLGLATVYGIVQQAGGLIDVQSEPGQGSRFEVRLPARNDRASASDDGDDDAAAVELERARPGEAVLVVEDSAPVRALLEQQLLRLGYQVEMVASGAQALARARELGPRLHLVLSDVIMPGGNGGELVQELRALQPELRVLLMTGHLDTTLVERGLLPEGAVLLRKPITLTALARALRQALDQEAAA